ncbi:jg3362 [Pararge aegeria aegeria]|uniref:Jg3362 protein n=1 Tax=Pararge aegeria aegeria TaxID=348720 RepID=A0A8S4RSU5_9NEOP|nr:jg3362 [Pararge aegeria aegeria]
MEFRLTLKRDFCFYPIATEFYQNLCSNKVKGQDGRDLRNGKHLNEEPEQKNTPKGNRKSNIQSENEKRSR